MFSFLFVFAMSTLIGVRTDTLQLFSAPVAPGDLIPRALFSACSFMPHDRYHGSELSRFDPALLIGFRLL